MEGHPPPHHPRPDSVLIVDDNKSPNLGNRSAISARLISIWTERLIIHLLADYPGIPLRPGSSLRRGAALVRPDVQREPFGTCEEPDPVALRERVRPLSRPNLQDSVGCVRFADFPRRRQFEAAVAPDVVTSSGASHLLEAGLLDKLPNPTLVPAMNSQAVNGTLVQSPYVSLSPLCFDIRSASSSLTYTVIDVSSRSLTVRSWFERSRRDPTRISSSRILKVVCRQVESYYVAISSCEAAI